MNLKTRMLLKLEHSREKYIEQEGDYAEKFRRFFVALELLSSLTLT